MIVFGIRDGNDSQDVFEQCAVLFVVWYRDLNLFSLGQSLGQRVHIALRFLAVIDPDVCTWRYLEKPTIAAENLISRVTSQVLESFGAVDNGGVWDGEVTNYDGGVGVNCTEFYLWVRTALDAQLCGIMSVTAGLIGFIKSC